MSVESSYDEIADRILKMGRLAAGRVNAKTLAAFRCDIERQQALVGDQSYYREWLTLVSAGPHAVAALLADETERGRYMRSVIPMRAFVARRERDMIFDRNQVPTDQQRHFA